YYERRVRRNPDDESRAINYVTILSFAERIEEAQKVFERLLEQPDLDGRTFYNAACFYVDDVHDLQAAMKLLRRALAAGFSNLDIFHTDTDLDPLRGLQEFQELLKEVDAKRQETS
ncbi:MAG TPA: hypothetical protein VET48_03470, partial [Steroidobacteraceae bacterium]|nr:hypothetical protein [Steroidobacteraceae bacterium]